MSGQRILVIGGVATGPKAAARARRRDPEAQITIVEKGRIISYSGCGLPYYVEGLFPEVEELWRTPAGTLRDPAYFEHVKDIQVRTETLAEAIDRDRKRVRVRHLPTGSVEELPYDKLVLATGGEAVCPPIEGRELEGVTTLRSPEEAVQVRSALDAGRIRQAVIVGAGPIGVEMVEAFHARGVPVTLVEMLDQVLPTLLDFEMARLLERHLKGLGVDLRLQTKVVRILGEGRVEAVELATGERVPADLVLFSVGVRPNARLAAEAGLELGPSGGIRVNEYLQTSDPDIFAGGDCVETPHRILERGVFLPLGSLANRHGRIIGDNLTGGRSRFEGALGTTVLQVAGFHVGRTGLTERQAREEGFAPWTALVPSPDHLHYMPTAKTIVVKLIADQETGRLLGGQIVGPGDAIKRTDVLATAIHFRATVDDLPAIDLGYAPPYSFPIDPIQHAANVLRNKRDGIAQGISPAELKAKLDAGEPVLLLDVRTPQEVAAQPFPHPQVVHIPLGALRRRAQTLPRDREIVTFCKISLRGYEAQKILNALGFTNVKFLDGGLVTWPYD